MPEDFITTNTYSLVVIFSIFILVFLAVTVFGLFFSIIRGNDTNLAHGCRKTAALAFAISLILMFLRFVII